MEKKIKNAINYFLKWRHYYDDEAFKKEAANYFADSYEEYLILLNHLEKFLKEYRYAKA